MSERHARGGAQRPFRVGEAVRHALAEVFARGDLHDSELAGHSITVTQVSMSPDLKNARAFVMPLGGVDREAILAALNRVAPRLQGEIARRVGLRFTPRLGFKLDETFDKADRVSELLRDPVVAADLAKPRED
ncbi:MAG: 30S ribosome-binding factor RbfA [Alphaproteobacteria bacterium]|nr:30S ribosome-binding factor RbfA [Alphaproteobacteria bacterium]